MVVGRFQRLQGFGRRREGTGVSSPGVGVDDASRHRVCTLVDPVRHCNSDAFQAIARRGAVAANRQAACHYLLVLSCWATLCSHTPVTASSPHTAAMKSRTGRDQTLRVSEARLHTQTRKHDRSYRCRQAGCCSSWWRACPRCSPAGPAPPRPPSGTGTTANSGRTRRPDPRAL